MKRSNLHLVLFVLLGLIPIAYNLTTNHLEAVDKEYALAVKSEELYAYQTEVEALRQDEEHYDYQIEDKSSSAKRSIASVDGEVPLSAPIVVPTPEPDFTVAEDNIKQIEQSIEDTKHEISTLKAIPDEVDENWMDWLKNHWMALMGTLNTIIFGWRWMHWRKEELNPVITAVFIGHNDLSMLSIGERLKLLFKSIYDEKSRNIYRLRKNAGWSIYSASYAKFKVVDNPRDVFAIRRTTVGWPTVMRFFGGFNITEPENESSMLTYGYMKNDSVETARAIRVTPFFENLKEIFDDGEDDYWIVILNMVRGNENIVYTGYFGKENIPSTLTGWELFLYSFKDRHCMSVKDASLQSIILLSPKRT